MLLLLFSSLKSTAVFSWLQPFSFIKLLSLQFTIITTVITKAQEKQPTPQKYNYMFLILHNFFFLSVFRHICGTS